MMVECDCIEHEMPLIMVVSESSAHSATDKELISSDDPLMMADAVFAEFRFHTHQVVLVAYVFTELNCVHFLFWK